MVARPSLASKLWTVCISLGLLLCCQYAVLAKEMPLWEGQHKDARLLEVDKKFVEGIRQATGNRLDRGAQHAIKRGWEPFNANDYEQAIRRFNQAWLLDPDNGALYWGFALTTHLRGDDLAVVERWFAEAENRLPNVAELLTDHGRILEEHDQPERALTYFKRSLVINPTSKLHIAA